MKAAGWDDPAPFWDDDGKAYLVTTNFAPDPKNGKSYNIHLFQMSFDGLALEVETDRIIYQARGSEANKLYKFNGLLDPRLFPTFWPLSTRLISAAP